MTKSPLRFKPPFLAHRGASASAPENTLAAFKKARDWGATWLEFDVMMAACGELLVFHDESLERTTNGKGLVRDYPYSYLKTLDAGAWFDKQFAGEKIPSLKEVLSFIKENQLFANIEIKALVGQEKEIVTRILELTETYPSAQLLFSSFSLPVLKELRQQSSNCHLGFLLDQLEPAWEISYQGLQGSTLNVNQALLKPELIKTLTASGLPLLAYTVNDPARAEELFSCGVTAVFTDCPDKMLLINP